MTKDRDLTVIFGRLQRYFYLLNGLRALYLLQNVCSGCSVMSRVRFTNRCDQRSYGFPRAPTLVFVNESKVVVPDFKNYSFANSRQFDRRRRHSKLNLIKSLSVPDALRVLHKNSAPDAAYAILNQILATSMRSQISPHIVNIARCCKFC